MKTRAEMVASLTAVLLGVLAAGCEGSTTCGGIEAGACKPADCAPPAARDGAQPAPDLSGAVSLALERRQQKTASDCGPTALWMVIGFLGGQETYADVMKHYTILPSIGVYDSHNAMAAMDLGYKATIISYNYRVIHPLWHELSGDELMVKLQSYLPKLQEEKDKVSAAGYIELLKRKGEIKFPPLSRELIVSYLLKGLPVMIAVDVEYLYRGMTTVDPFRPDHWTHALVVHGYDPTTDEFEVADPWFQIPLPHKDGHYRVSSGRLLTAILLAFQFNDGSVVVVEKS
jgi:hypothetical protein